MKRSVAMTRLAFLAAACLLLAGCGVPYGKDSGYGGYTDGPVEKSLYHIVFASPGGLDDPAIRDLALLRAAEVCRDHGYAWFAIVRENKGYAPRASLAPRPDAYIYAAHPVWVPGPPGHGPTLVMVHDPFGPDWPPDRTISARYCELYVRGYATQAAAEGKAYRVGEVIPRVRAQYKIGTAK